MQETLDLIESNLKANGNSMPYADLHSSMPYPHNLRLMQGIRILKGAGNVTNVVAFDAANRTTSHTINWVGA